MTNDTGHELQRDQAGRLRHLLTLDGLSRDELNHLLDLAQFYVRVPGELPARDQSLWGRTVANLFFEPSTRTRVSFELAAKRLGADVVNLDMQSSSRVKGETVLDTIYTLSRARRCSTPSTRCRPCRSTCSSCATPNLACRRKSHATSRRT